MPVVTSPVGSQRSTDQRRVYVPRIPVRNSSTPDALAPGSPESTSTIGTYLTADTAQTVSTNVTTPPPSEVGSLPQSPSSYQPSSSSSLRSPRSPAPQTAAAKKKGSLLGFFSVKEPSSAAFAQLETQLKKQGTNQHGRVNPVGMPGVSSSKLPPTVPKVNSKWDGVPEAVRQKEKEKDKEKDKTFSQNRQSFTPSGRSLSAGPLSAGRDRRFSASTLGSFSSRGGPADRSSIFVTEHGNASGSSSFRSKADSTSLSSGSETRDFTKTFAVQSLKSPSTTTLPEISYHFPEEEIPDLPEIPRRIKEDSDIKTPLKPLFVPPRSTPTVLPTVIERLAEPPDHTNSPSLTSSEPSPVTPITPPPFQGTDRHHEGTPKNDNIKSTVISLPSDEQVMVMSSGANVLGPPATAKRKVRTQGFLAGEAEPLRLPDDDEESSPTSILKTRDSTPRRTTAPSRPPISSYFRVSDIDLEKRPDSSRMRLGLRASMRSGDAAPWETNGQSRDQDGEVERNLTPTPTSPQNAKGLFKPGKLGLFNRENSEK